MIRVDHLRLCLIEECDESSKCMTKLMRFGPKAGYPGQTLNNTERLVDELNDLMGAIALLVDEGEIPADWLDQRKVEAKKEKIERYLLKSRELGTLTD